MHTGLARIKIANSAEHYAAKKATKADIISLPMTMTEFAVECRKHAYYAVNLDMGTYGYGRINGRVRSWWTIFWRGMQTNWIYTK